MAARIFIVDDEKDIADTIQDIMAQRGHLCSKFSTGDEFLRHWHGELEGCVLLDMRMAGRSGLQILSEMKEAVRILPVLMITSVVDVQLAVDAMKAGAFDFLSKPFTNEKLVEKVGAALAYNRRMLDDQKGHVEVLSALSQLTSREREILNYIVEGQTSKAIATNLGISAYTVDNHRARILDKMRATTSGQLVQMVVTATVSSRR